MIYSPLLQSNSFWSSFNGQICIELIGGIIGSFIFLFVVLFLFKPKVKIGKFLCRVQPNSGMPIYYSFKFVNTSFFSAHDIKVELHLVKKIPMGNGEFNNLYSQLTLVNGHISHIPARPPFWRKTLHHPHCVLVRSTEELNTILSDEMNAIVIKVSLKHGLTGLSKVFEREYANETDIKSGKFQPGTKFGVI